MPIEGERFNLFISYCLLNGRAWKRGLESNKTDEEEEDFRERYSEQLRGKKQQVYNTQMGHHALDDERQQVNQQAMKTPGRRGEIIKNEQIDKEFSKRYREHNKP